MAPINQLQGEVGAEECFNQTLALAVQLGDRSMQATALGQLGLLYGFVWERPEEAVPLFRRAKEMKSAHADLTGAGLAYHNLAETFRGLHRHDAAREAMKQGIKWSEPYGHAVSPWAS